MPILQLVLATAFWGCLFSVGKLVSPYLPPFAVTFARYGLAAAILLPFAWRELRRVERKDVPRLIVVGLLSSLFFNAFLFFGLQFAPAADAVLAPAIVPILMTALGAIFLHERPSFAKVASLGVSVFGVVLVFSAAMQGEAGSLRLLGDLLNFGAALSWSGYLLLCAPLGVRYSPLLLTTVTCLAGTFGALPLAVWEGGLGRFLALPGVAWLEVFYIAVMGSVGAFLLWSRGSQAVGPARASAFMNLVPIFGLLSSVVLLKEHLGLLQLLGIALVLAGVWGATLASRGVRVEQPAIARP